MLLIALILLLLQVHAQDRQWTRQVGGSGDDVGWGIAVNSASGAVYVAGSARVSLHGETYVAGDDIVLMKYAINGTRVWTKMSGTSGSDLAYKVAVDTLTGDVYVAGSTSGSLHGETLAGGSDIVLMKYASNGTRIWTKLAGSSVNDAGYSVAVDPARSAVYVAGYASGSVHSQTFVGGRDIVLIRYATNGTRVWTKMVGTSGNDEIYGMALDYASGDVYITGYASGNLHGETVVGVGDIVTMKFASNGTRVWTKLAGTASDDWGNGLAVESATGSVYMIGAVRGSIHGEASAGSNDVAIIKYASNGTRIWTKLIGTSFYDEGVGVVTDGNGGVLLTGSVGASLHGQTYAGDSDLFLVKYASNGTRIWTKMMGTTGSDVGWAISLDSTTGYVYVSGEAGGSIDGQSYSGGREILVTSYSTIPATSQPTVQPTVPPTRSPTSPPSALPTRQPTGQPSGQPTGNPTGQPSRQPSAQPTASPVSGTICQVRTFRETKSQTEFTRHRCFRPPSS